MGFPSFLMSAEMLDARREQQEREVARRLKVCKEWNPNKWEAELNVKGYTYRPLELFPNVSTSGVDARRLSKKQHVDSPCGKWRYVVKELEAGQMLPTYSAGGKLHGSVLFDSAIRIPALHDKVGDEPWSDNPWMSITPMEILSLRLGTRRAKGVVVVAGLGLGHQLIEVCKRKAVTGIILVERDQSLVDWLLPEIQKHIDCPIRVVVGDAYEEIPKLKANVVLLDIFRAYGGNNRERDKLVKSCRPGQFDFVWAWGG